MLGTEALQPESRSLAELTGRQLDIAGYTKRLGDKLQRRSTPLDVHIQKELFTHAEITQKIARYGERTPVSPLLPELTARLEQAIYMSGPTPPSEREMIELLAHWEAELRDAEDYFDD